MGITGRNSSYSTCIKTSLCLMMDAIDVLGVGFVFLTNSAAGATSTGHPGQPKGTPRKVPEKGILNTPYFN